MASSQSRVNRNSFRTLFNLGTIGELTDGQLLERFAAGGGELAELAFAALVERHGPVVLHVCRSVLRDEHDAQDAFQATFLVLVRKARSLWVRDSLAPWLHAVAYRAACCSRAARIRRSAHERNKARSASTSGNSMDCSAEVQCMLHEEIERLPARYRSPVILCDLEGRTYEQAARSLGCPIGTLKSRLTRGRERLRGQLIRRGLGPVIGLGAVLVVEESLAAVPAALAESTYRSVLQFAAGGPTVGGVPAAVMALVKGVLRKMTMDKLRTVLVTPLIVLTLGAVVIAQQGPDVEKKTELKVPSSPVQPTRRLRDAVAEFNASAAKLPVGKDQPPLTDEEVIASIRGWIRDLRPPISDEGYEAFQEIAKSGDLPADAKLTWTTSWQGYRGFHFDVWWVDLTIPTGNGQGYTYRIRDRMIRSRLLNGEERRIRGQERERFERRQNQPKK